MTGLDIFGALCVAFIVLVGDRRREDREKGKRRPPLRLVK